MDTGIYQIKNLKTRKIYIGSAAGRFGITGRWDIHKSHLRLCKHCNQHLQRAWNKYGENAFVFEILEKCQSGACIKREQHYLDILLFARNNDDRFHQLGYNICRIAGNTLGYKHSEEAKLQMSKMRGGKTFSQEHKQKLSKAHRGENNHNSKLTKDDIITIKHRIYIGDKCVDIARDFNISRQTVSHIKHGRKWKYVYV